jgi:ferrous iron transport protein B
MKLSDLQTGEKGVIVKVSGHGGFRKRIVEMGFVRGKNIEVILNAPLKDPVKYKLMGYEVSLRRQEAELIEIITEEEAAQMKTENLSPNPDKPFGMISEEELTEIAIQKGRTIKVALVGNPNSGKTSLFNVASGAHERVGNYSGVTVDAKEGRFKYQGYNFKIVDLPGTYSLSAYTPEERYVRRHIAEELPDVIINVVDASNLERNLYLTTQLIDMNVRMVIALNMYDELEESGSQLDDKLLSQLLGVPMIPTNSKKGWGIDSLFKTVINLYERTDGTHHDCDTGLEKVCRHIHINHGTTIESSIEKVRARIAVNESISAKFSIRNLSIKLLEKDEEVEKMIASLPNGEEIIQTRDREAASIESQLGEDSESAIVNAKYGFIDGALRETLRISRKEGKGYTKRIDAVVLHKWLSYPIFVGILCVIFASTFLLGDFPKQWIEAGVDWLAEWVNRTMPEGALTAMFADGIIGGVGAVAVFLPHILILYLFLSFLEDSGYMARGAFIMDKMMHKVGLHGKSFIPLVMGFGCNVPAVMATRTIESRKSRLISMLINPFMSCATRLTVYMMIIRGVLFPEEDIRSQLLSAFTLVSICFIGIVLAAIMAKIFSSKIFKGEDLPFVMELPPYRMPTRKAIGRHTWVKCKQYLKKMGGIILIGSIVIWFLGYFPDNDPSKSKQERTENSYLSRIGRGIEPGIKPLGFDWKMGIGILAGVSAKELVISTLNIVYGKEDVLTKLRSKQEIRNMGDRKHKPKFPFAPLNAFVYMLFILIYFPCIATIAAIKKESGSWKYALISFGYSTALAWVVCFLVYQIGSLWG